jgi:hypothetical protein
MPNDNSGIVEEAAINPASLVPIEETKPIIAQEAPSIPPAMPTADVTVALGSQLNTKIRQAPLYGGAVPVTPLQKIAQSAQANAAAMGVATKITEIAVAPVAKTVSTIQSTPTAPPVTDGLVHGYDTWPDDPAFILLRDDFIMGSGASGYYGELNWYGGGNGTVMPGSGFGGFPNMCGVLDFTVGSTANGTMFLIPGVNANIGGALNNDVEPILPFFDYPSWQMTWIFALQRYELAGGGASPFPALAQTSFYMGMGAFESFGGISTGARPPVFVGLRFDTDPTAPAISDSYFTFEAVANPVLGSYTRNNNQGNVYITSLQPKEQVPYRFTMRCTSAGMVQMRLLSNAGEDSGWQNVSIPQVSWTGAYNYGNTQGIVDVLLYDAAPTGSGYVYAAPGSHIGIINWVGGSFSSFTRTLCRFNDVSLDWLVVGGEGTTLDQNTAVLTYYPGAYFYVGFGNDSQSSPPNTRALLLDFFSFLWNPGVGSSTAGGGAGIITQTPASPNPLLARFF